jgi:hypothetical protein
MANGRDDEPAAGPSQPPILGTDPTPWMGMDAIMGALSPPPASADRNPDAAPSPLNMNVQEFLSLDRDLQDRILKTWGGDVPGFARTCTHKIAIVRQLLAAANDMGVAPRVQPIL